METAKSKIPAQLRGLFCEPPLLEGEDPDLYWGIFAALVDERKPVTPADWIAVNDRVTKLWEERAFRRAANTIIRSGMTQALARLLSEMEQPELEERSAFFEPQKGELRKRRAEAAEGRARRYGSDPEETKEIGSLLARFRITDTELHAKAFEQNSEVLQMIERMLSQRERGRRKLSKEDERRRRGMETAATTRKKTA